MSMEDYMGQIRENNNTGSHHHQQQKFLDYPMTFFQNEDEALKAKIISHPHYSNLLQAYMDCQKVEHSRKLREGWRCCEGNKEYEARQQQRATATTATAIAAANNVYKDPELDQFMEAYYDMLIKYKEELTRPIQEAMEFMRRIESQLSSLTISSSSSPATDHDHPRMFISPGVQVKECLLPACLLLSS
ncbi:homeobox protein knotted-1-like protein 2 [Tanacetum coccineum]